MSVLANLPANTAAMAAVRIAVVVPLFKHSGLVWEALASAFEQSAKTGYGVVLVNDGCPFSSTHAAGMAAAAAAPVPFLYTRQTNQGLSGARNTGVEAALDAWPGLEAFYFLDADNRLSRDSLRNMLELLERDPEADWFYPDINMIGLNDMYSMQGRYNTALHAEMNICEAGSLIRRRIFDAGVRYDETMKKGYEDWEFWFSAIDAGFFNGRHAPEINYRYRLRPESMLRDSKRSDQEIRAHMVAKHPWLDRPHDLTRISDEDPEARFAFITPEGGGYLNHAQADFTLFPLEKIKEDFHRWRVKPGAYGFPGKVIFADRAALSALEAEGVLPWMIWKLERCLASGADVASLRTKYISDERLELSEEIIMEGDMAYEPSVVTMVSARLLREVSREAAPLWLSSLMTNWPQPKHATHVLSFPAALNETTEDSSRLLLSFSSQLFDRAYNSDESAYWVSTHGGTDDRLGRVRSFDSERAGAVQIAHLPQPSGARRRRIAFVLPIADFGGVERVAYQVAFALREKGYEPHLVCIGQKDLRIPSDFRRVFQTVSCYTSQNLTQYSRGPFLGTFLSSDLPMDEIRYMHSLFEGMDVAINCHCSDFHSIAGRLKRRGVLCFDYQHIVEFTTAGQPVGHPFQGLAFEHAYAATLTCSEQLATWMRGQGVPSEKLLAVRNGPGMLTTDADLDQVAKRLTARNPGAEANRPLRVLFLGRLEYQKGLDRLITLIHRTADQEIDWRVVGKAVVSDAELSLFDEAGIEVEPPLYSSEDLRDVFEWADVLIHPSRYEGLPLVIIDAMSNGVPVIATDVGAVGEALDDGQTGFLLPEDEFVLKAGAILEELIGDRAKLLELSAGGLRRARGLQWQQSVDMLSHRIETLLINRKRAECKSGDQGNNA